MLDLYIAGSIFLMCVITWTVTCYVMGKEIGYERGYKQAKWHYYDIKRRDDDPDIEGTSQ